MMISSDACISARSSQKQITVHRSELKDALHGSCRSEISSTSFSGAFLSDVGNHVPFLENHHHHHEQSYLPFLSQIGVFGNVCKTQLIGQPSTSLSKTMPKLCALEAIPWRLRYRENGWPRKICLVVKIDACAWGPNDGVVAWGSELLLQHATRANLKTFVLASSSLQVYAPPWGAIKRCRLLLA